MIRVVKVWMVLIVRRLVMEVLGNSSDEVSSLKVISLLLLGHDVFIGFGDEGDQDVEHHDQNDEGRQSEESLEHSRCIECLPFHISELAKTE